MTHPTGQRLQVAGHHPMGRAATTFWLWLFMSLTVSLWAQGPAREYDVKATLLFNFCQFVEWPTNAFAAVEAPLVIGILGADPFGRFLDDLVKGEKAQGGRPIVVRRLRRLEDARPVHILFIAKPEIAREDAVIRRVRTTPVLLVSDGDDKEFLRRGGAVTFLKQQEKVRLAINPAAAREAGLSISAKLLQVAEIHPVPDR